MTDFIRPWLRSTVIFTYKNQKSIQLCGWFIKRGNKTQLWISDIRIWLNNRLIRLTGVSVKRHLLYFVQTMRTEVTCAGMHKCIVPITSDQCVRDIFQVRFNFFIDKPDLLVQKKNESINWACKLTGKKRDRTRVTTFGSSALRTSWRTWPQNDIDVQKLYPHSSWRIHWHGSTG